MKTTLAVIGLGYVGLPLAVAFARTFPAIGFDLDPSKIGRLAQGVDTTGEVGEEDFRKAAPLTLRPIRAGFGRPIASSWRFPHRSTRPANRTSNRWQAPRKPPAGL
jgi:hypothetical protein